VGWDRGSQGPLSRGPAAIRAKEAQRMKERRRREVRREERGRKATVVPEWSSSGANRNERKGSDLGRDSRHGSCSQMKFIEAQIFVGAGLGGSRGGREENDFRAKQGGRSEMSSRRSSARSFPSAELLMMKDVLEHTEEVDKEEMESSGATKRTR